MKKICLIISTLLLMYITQMYPQNGLGIITGKVLDKDSKAFIEYANIVLLSIKDSSVITGTVSNADGIFKLSGIEFGKYTLEVRFIAYKTSKYDIEINPEKQIIDLGEIFIRPDAVKLNDVIVKG